MAQVAGRLVNIEAARGLPPVNETGWVDITADNRTGFDVSITQSSRTANDSGRINTEAIDFRRGTISFTVDDTETTRPLFLPSGGQLMSFRESVEGKEAGNAFTVYVCNMSISIEGETEGAVTYSVTGTIRQEPVEGTH